MPNPIPQEHIIRRTLSLSPRTQVEILERCVRVRTHTSAILYTHSLEVISAYHITSKEVSS